MRSKRDPRREVDNANDATVPLIAINILIIVYELVLG